MRSQTGVTRRVAAGVAAFLVLGLLGGCAAASSRTIVRSADDVQVLSPAEVKAMKAEGSGAGAAGAAGPGETVPQNADKRQIGRAHV